MCKRLIYLISFVLVLVAVPPVTHAQVENLLLNPSFEEDEAILDDPDWEQWTTWNDAGGAGSNATVVDIEFIDGTRSLRIEPIGSTDWFFIVLQDYIPLAVGTDYTVSFWAKAEAPRPLGSQMKAEDNSVAWGWSSFQLTTEWAEYTYTSEALNAVTKLEFSCAGVETPFWLDFVYVYEGQYVAGIEPGGGASPEQVSDPKPADGQTDLPRDAVLSWTPGVYAAPINGHKVYFSENFNDVNDGIGGVTQDANSYTPGQRLDFNTTYYWRVDEVNNVNPDSPWIGDIWSFTTEPIAYPVENITATASSSLLVETGPDNTINGSGLDADDLHSREQIDMWISDEEIEPNRAWIEFEFDKIYKLHEMLVWNSNAMTESFLGYGYKDVIIEYSVDGNDYTTLGATHEFVQAPGTPGYAHNTTIEFGGAAVKNVRLTANNNWGGIMDQYSLSEVRFLYIPLRAREPQPDSGATDVDLDLVLSFRAGREAAEHNVYISTDEQAVIDSNVPVSIVTEAQDGPKSLDLGETYYWKVNEVNMAETSTMLQGDIWNFTTVDSLVVEDFESYHDDIEAGEEGSNQVYLTWIDGYLNPLANGSTIGYAVAYQPSMETDTVHDGSQSVPFSYDNSVATYSEATVNIANLAIGGNWALHGIKSLSLWFYGDPNNTPEQMYVKLNDVKVLYNGEADNVTKSSWRPWDIDLADFAGVDLSNVIEFSIGFERIGLFGGSGTVLFDNIRLYGPVPIQVGNLLLNPSFEEDEAILDDPDWAQWTTWNPAEGAGSSATIVDTESIDGARSLRVDAIGTDSGDFIVLQDFIPLRVGRDFTVIFWAKAESPRSLSVQMKASDNSVSWGWTDFQLTTEWAEYTMTSQAENAEAKLEFSCAGVEVPFWLDLVSVYEGDYVPSESGN